MPQRNYQFKKNKMRQYKYTGIFKNKEGHTYSLQVSCNGFTQAFFLLTADAIRTGKHYQLSEITDEKGIQRGASDIEKMKLFSY